MVTVLLQSLLLAAGGILSVGSITFVILLLLSDQGRRNGLAYMAGYLGAYTLIGVSVVLAGFTVAENGSGESGRFPALLFVLLGALLLWLAQRNWRNPPADDRQSPRLFAVLDKVTPLKALGLGALVTVINIKNLAIFLSAVSISLLSDLPLASKLLIVILVALVFCLAVSGPVLIAYAFPRQAEKILNEIKHTLEYHRRPIGIWVPLVFGTIFLLRGLLGLV